MSGLPDEPGGAPDTGPAPSVGGGRVARGALGRFLRAVLLLPLLVLAGVAALWALAHGEAFSAWLLRQLPGVTITQAKGALLGDFSAERIDVALPRGGRLWLVAPRWQGLRLVLDPGAPWGLGVHADAVSVRVLDLNWVGDPASPSATPPDDLNLPVSLSLPMLQVTEARSALWGAPLQQLQLSLQSREGAHRLQLQSLQWSGWRLGASGASMRLGASAPLPMQMSVVLQAPPGDLPGELRVQAQGPLADLQLQALLRGPDEAGKALPPRLSLAVHVRPFAPWPLVQARVVARTLDLSALQLGARTRLDGELSLSPSGARGLVMDIDLRNEGATAWGQGGLPLLGLKGQVLAPEAQTLASPWLKALAHAHADMRLSLPSLRGRAPGTVTLQGEWDAQASVRLLLDGVQPQALHGAAPPLLLQGEVRMRPQWADAPSQADLQRVQLDAQLRGVFGRAHAQPVQAAAWPAVRQPLALDLDGEWRPTLWTVRELRLRAGDLSAAGRVSEARLRDGLLRWQEGPTGQAGQAWQAWQAQGELDVQRFDPQVWLPWPQGLSRSNSLSAQGRFDIDQRGHGLADVTLLPGTLAGVPVQGELHWRASDTSAMHLQAELDVAGNHLQAQGEGAAQQGAGAAWLAGAWHLNLTAGQLQALSPLAPLFGMRQFQGALQADARWQGAWPPRDSQGQFKAQDLRLSRSDGSTLALAAAAGDWRWGAQGGLATSPPQPRQPQPSAAEHPLHLQATVQGLRAGSVQIDQALATLDGSLAAHQGRIEGQGRVPAWPSAARWVLALDGGWQTQGETSRWRGRLSQAQVSANEAQGSAPGGTVWLQAQPTDIAWQQGPDGHSLTVQPTRVSVWGAELALERLRWQGGANAAAAQNTQNAQDKPSASATQSLDLLLRLAPLNLPQWLARWQPQAGWGGDLTVGGQVRVLHPAGRAWEVDAELARQAGDLTLSEPTVEGQTAQRLGLREARVSLTVRNGLWTLKQALDGRVVGRVSGQQSVQARDPMSLPQADAPVSGEVDMQVASLRPLATWAPAGWRLNGQLQAHAQIGGTLGAPRWTGVVQGEQLAISQSLLGVHLSEGQLRIELDGERAKLTRFVASGGPQGGRLLADGEATLGAAPRLNLHVQAERFAALQRIDRRIVLSGDTQTGLSADSLQVRGHIQVDEGLIDIGRSEAPTLGEDVAVHRRPGAPPEDDMATSGGPHQGSSGGNASNAQRQVDADIALDLGQQLRLKGHGLDGLLMGQLQVSTPSNKPAIKGAVRLAQGTFAAYGQKLRIERSTITFTGLVDNPRLDILAMRPQSPTADESDVRVGVRITGTALDPRIRLYSEPALSETEQLSWLVLGRAPTGLGGADIGLLQSAAVALLSGESREGPTDKIIGLLGLDNLSVRQSEGTVRDTVVNVGKQVSRHWYVGYERNLNATGGNWQLIYSLAQRFKLRAQAGEDNAIDLIWQWRWD